MFGTSVREIANPKFDGRGRVLTPGTCPPKVPHANLQEFCVRVHSNRASWGELRLDEAQPPFGTGKIPVFFIEKKNLNFPKDELESVVKGYNGCQNFIWPHRGELDECIKIQQLSL